VPRDVPWPFWQLLIPFTHSFCDYTVTLFTRKRRCWWVWSSQSHPRTVRGSATESSAEISRWQNFDPECVAHRQHSMSSRSDETICGVKCNFTNKRRIKTVKIIRGHASTTQCDFITRMLFENSYYNCNRTLVYCLLCMRITVYRHHHLYVTDLIWNSSMLFHNEHAVVTESRLSRYRIA